MDKFVFNHTTAPTQNPDYTPTRVIFQPGEKSKKHHKKKEKKQHKLLRTMRRDINCLAEKTKQLQQELQYLRDHDSDGFIILRRRG